MNLPPYIKSIGGFAAATGITPALAALRALTGFTGVFAQAVATVTTTLDSTQLNKDRTVTVTFTVECSEDAAITGYGAGIKQTTERFGNKRVYGSNFSEEDDIVNQPAYNYQ